MPGPIELAKIRCDRERAVGRARRGDRPPRDRQSRSTPRRGTSEREPLRDPLIADIGGETVALQQPMHEDPTSRSEFGAVGAARVGPSTVARTRRPSRRGRRDPRHALRRQSVAAVVVRRAKSPPSTSAAVEPCADLPPSGPGEPPRRRASTCDALRRGPPCDRLAAPAAASDEPRRATSAGQHFGETAAARLHDALLHHGAQIQPIARTSQRHVQQPLGLLALPVRLVFVGAATRKSPTATDTSLVVSPSRFESAPAGSPCRATG